MAKKFEFQFDLDEDEETWLTPQLSERSVGTQSKPVDLKEWFGQIQTSDRASLLSKKLQKYAQKRAARNERLRLAASTSLDVVAEADGSPEPVSASEDFKTFDSSSASMFSSHPPYGVQQTDNKEHPSVLEHGFDSGIANSSSDPSDSTLNTSPTLTTKLVSSTPLHSSENRSFGDAEDKSPSPIPAAPAAKPEPSDSDDEFFDASSDFSEEVQQLLLTSSLHEDQLGGNGMLPDDDSGISVVRNCMTQSLMKVEEESPVSQLIVQPNNSKPLRSSSVSPRPLATVTSNMKPSKMNNVPSNEYTESLDQLRNQHSTTTPLSSRSRGTTAKPQARLSRPATTTLRPLATPRPAGQSATPLGLSQRHVAQSTVRVPNPKAQPDNAVSRAASVARPSPQSQDDIPDLAALREIARQQEEG
ncbi:hypothetical protein ANCCAN_02443 [Ancylostoma caninum]|uniref:Uncharacterized protein n=1 Tax=Ancylostoma caninum TaxID=29170 RepID=A0A368H4F1_ANCCA|nr:hypothetical protein ANCCAN_02443 [Ancylostoma caninum]